MADGGYLLAGQSDSPADGDKSEATRGSYDFWTVMLGATGTMGAKKWEFAAGSPISSSPAIGSDGTVYFGSYDNKVYALNPNGTEKWNFVTGNKLNSSPAIGPDGTIYVGFCIASYPTMWANL